VAGTAAFCAAGALTEIADAHPWGNDESARARVTIRVVVAYAGRASLWKGSFMSVLPTARVVDRGSVVDRPRQKLGADWLIRRTLTGKSGTLRFLITGPYSTPTAKLTWKILSGTGAYAGLTGTGTDVEHVIGSGSKAHASMSGVPMH
jgi:hypothetical protein